MVTESYFSLPSTNWEFFYYFDIVCLLFFILFYFLILDSRWRTYAIICIFTIQWNLGLWILICVAQCGSLFETFIETNLWTKRHIRINSLTECPKCVGYQTCIQEEPLYLPNSKLRNLFASRDNNLALFRSWNKRNPKYHCTQKIINSTIIGSWSYFIESMFHSLWSVKFKENQTYQNNINNFIEPLARKW